MALFLSTYVNKVDKKGRISVPAPFRAALAGQTFNGIVAFRSHKLSALEASGIDRMERLSASLDDLDMFSDAHDDLTAAIFADAHQLPFDGEGRVTLAPELADFLGIEDSAALVGRGPTFQIWEPEAFGRYQAEARARNRDQGLTLRLRRPDQSGDAS
ncbi:MAG: division/cell wall cluster transcriptional repressor MraZ [Alphaproteobacteria bacterium]